MVRERSYLVSLDFIMGVMAIVERTTVITSLTRAEWKLVLESSAPFVLTCAS